jgi:hypothetical protein
MTKFVDSYEYILRENAIRNYITNSTKIQIKDDILKMIKEYNVCYQKYMIDISSEFPTDILIKIMSPYLHLYLTAYYSLVPKNKSDAKYRLSRKLKEFQKFNPSFGRKVIVFKNKIENGRFVRYKSHVDFNTKHKKFNIHTSQNFMNNHLSYKYNDDNIDDDIDEENHENINVSTHHTMTNFNLFRIFIVQNNRETNYEEIEDEIDIEDEDEDTNLESDTNSELVQDYYDEIPDEDSIS